MTHSDTPADVQIILVNGDPNPNRPDLPHWGAGEASLKPTAAAIANAIYDATGVRIRRVPFRKERVLAAPSFGFPCKGGPAPSRASLPLSAGCATLGHGRRPVWRGPCAPHRRWRRAGTGRIWRRDLLGHECGAVVRLYNGGLRVPAVSQEQGCAAMRNGRCEISRSGASAVCGLGR